MRSTKNRIVEDHFTKSKEKKEWGGINIGI